MSEELPNIDIETMDLSKPAPVCKINSLLPSSDLGLTPDEAEEYAAYEAANQMLGPAAGAVLLCPGNQESTPVSKRCPYFDKCPLRRAGKAPADKLCPIERNITGERFSAWCKELGKEPDELTESERSIVSDLTWIDLQISRCMNILSSASNSQLMQTNITDAVLLDPNSPPIVITTERVLHVTTQRLDQLSRHRRAILHDWMLTPEQKFKLQKEQNKKVLNAKDFSPEDDPSTEQSALSDKLKKIII